MNAVHTAPSKFFKIHFNIILYLHLSLYSALFRSGSLNKILYGFVFSFMLHSLPTLSSLTCSPTKPYWQ
jgi:hypothetical protein